MQEADDFRAESRALHALLEPIDPERFTAPTQFKGWSINDVLQHLHVWNKMAALQLSDEAEIERQFASLIELEGKLRVFEAELLDGLSGAGLLAAWIAGAESLADAFAGADPKQRLKWVGPSMSARSSITARLMETWAHGQEVYDELGVVRANADRIRGIVVLGVNTYRWTYMAHGAEPPGPMPQLVLTAPSGAVWTHGEAGESGLIEGLAEDFCQVVTQTRNVKDTGLNVSGEIATDWMSKAQCFAGPPATPPKPGERFTRTSQH